MKSVIFVLLIAGLALADIEQVHVGLTGKPDEMSIMWITRPQFNENTNAKYTVTYGYKSNDLKQKETNVKSVKYYAKTYTATVHEAVLKGLRTGKRVYYRVSDGSTTTKEFSFPTSFAKNSTHPQFKFLTYGDLDINNDSRQTLDLVTKLVQNDKDIRFIIHQGDIPYAWSEDGNSPNKWDQWGNMAEHITANIPYMTTVGNHEEFANFTSYKHRFTNTTGENSGSIGNGNLFYSFNYGSVHFVGLSSEHSFTKSSVQYNWLKEDLNKVNRTETPFVILYAHRPMYCSNTNHGSSIEFRKALQDLLVRYKVDIFLFGHVHAYERTCPMLKDGQCVNSEHTYYYHNPEGTIHLVIGTAGYEANQHWEEKPDWSVYRETTHGLLRVTVMDPTVLYAQFIRSDGSIADQFMIDKKEPKKKKKKQNLQLED